MSEGVNRGEMARLPSQKNIIYRLTSYFFISLAMAYLGHVILPRTLAKSCHFK